MPIDYSKMSVYGDTYGNTQEDLDATQQDQETGIAEILLPNINTPYLNQDGGQNQIFSQEEYEKALANQNAKPQSNNFLSGIFSNVMDSDFVQGARNLGSMITNPLMGGLGFLASKVDKFDTLPIGDQEFIKSQMGYTGPTVFGENNSGLSKDKYGINVRSAFGNYAEYVEKDLARVQEALAKAKNKYMTKYGAGWEDIYNKNTKFLQQKEIDRQEQIDEKNRQQVLRELEAERVASVQRNLDRGSYVTRDSSGMSASDRAVGGGAGVAALGASASARGSKSAQGYSQHAKGGRIGYGTGGIVTL